MPRGLPKSPACGFQEGDEGVDFVFGNGKLEIFSSGKDVGDSQVEVPIPYEGDEVRIRLDPFFVMDFLRILDLDRTFQIAFRDEFTAVLLKTAKKRKYSFCVMGSYLWL